MSTTLVTSAQEFIPLFQKDVSVSLIKAKLTGNKIASYLAAPFKYIPQSVYGSGKRIFSILTPKTPIETGAFFLTPETLQCVDFQHNSIQLQKNFTAIFDCLKQYPQFNNLTILYNPEKNSEIASAHLNGQIIFDSALANLTEEEACAVLCHELSHYVHQEGWISDAYNLCAGAASVALYFNHSFLAFSLAQIAFFKGSVQLQRYFEFRADKYGVDLLNKKEGAISLNKKNVIEEFSVCLANSNLVNTYQQLSQSEKGEVFRYIAQNYRAVFDLTHPSPWDRLQAIQQLLLR